MPLPYHPQRGEILTCDFTGGFVAPEMLKKRPVIVVSRRDSHGRRLCTVVPISTTAPSPVQLWHHALTLLEIPGWQPEATMWAKCDMLATVSFERLNQPYLRLRHGRKHIATHLAAADLSAVEACMRHYLLLP